MNPIIDADAAKLAGLQIDLLQKIRNGQVTLQHLEFFLRLSTKNRDRLVKGEKLTWGMAAAAEAMEEANAGQETETAKKFALFVDLGEITVPADYVHETRLATFRKKNDNKFYFYNGQITDVNFPNPTRVLKPGDKLRVRAFKQVVGGTTTSEERMAFLATQKAIHTGAQGASLVFDQKRGQLPKGKWYASFDEKDRLWADAGYHRVPYVHCDSHGGFKFTLGIFEGVWDDGNAFLCFTEVKPTPRQPSLIGAAGFGG